MTGECNRSGLGAAAALALLGLAFAACGGREEAPGREGTRRAPVRVELRPLNDSGVTGTASLSDEGDRLRVSIEARELRPERVHPHHIHSPGASHARLGPSGPGTCPPLRADDDGDGRISLEEGEAFYGPVALPLTPSPPASAEGRLRFEETFPVGSSAELLEQGVVVLHGAPVDGTAAWAPPVACGALAGSGPRPLAGGEPPD